MNEPATWIHYYSSAYEGVALYRDYQHYYYRLLTDAYAPSIPPPTHRVPPRRDPLVFVPTLTVLLTVDIMPDIPIGRRCIDCPCATPACISSLLRVFPVPPTMDPRFPGPPTPGPPP